MSIDDDLFDIQHAVEGTPDEETFDRVMKYIAGYELALEEAHKRLETMNHMKKAFREFMQDG